MIKQYQTRGSAAAQCRDTVEPTRPQIITSRADKPHDSIDLECDIAFIQHFYQLFRLVSSNKRQPIMVWLFNHLFGSDETTPTL